MSSTLRSVALACICSLLVASCGGGGSTNGGNTTELAPLTAQNAETMAGVVVRQILNDNVIGTIGTPGIPFVSLGPDAGEQLLSLASRPAAAGTLAASVNMENCAVSGTIDVTISVANPLTLSPGDEFGFEFAQCDDGSGVVVDGGFVMSVTDFDGDLQAGQYLLGLSLALDAFTITQNGQSSGASGTIAFTIDTRTPQVTTLTLSTSLLTTTAAGTAETVNNLSITITEDESVFPTAVSVQTSFRLSSPQLGGDVQVSTSVALQRSGDEFPFAGEIEIRGAANATITVIALDANTARLEIDLDGDGATDETRDVTWSDLLAAANAA